MMPRYQQKNETFLERKTFSLSSVCICEQQFHITNSHSSCCALGWEMVCIRFTRYAFLRFSGVKKASKRNLFPRQFRTKATKLGEFKSSVAAWQVSLLHHKKTFNNKLTSSLLLNQSSTSRHFRTPT